VQAGQGGLDGNADHQTDFKESCEEGVDTAGEQVEEREWDSEREGERTQRGRYTEIER